MKWMRIKMDEESKYDGNEIGASDKREVKKKMCTSTRGQKRGEKKFIERRERKRKKERKRGEEE